MKLETAFRIPDEYIALTKKMAGWPLTREERKLANELETKFAEQRRDEKPNEVKI